MPLSVLKDIRKVYAGLNADEIRGAAAQDLNIGLMASNPESYRRMEEFLARSPAATSWLRTRLFARYTRSTDLHAVSILCFASRVFLCRPMDICSMPAIRDR